MPTLATTMADAQTKPQSPEPNRWVDIDDNSSLELPAAASISGLQLYVEDLKIDEEKKTNKFLDDPEDSNIKAVTSGDTPYSSASTFEDLSMSPELLKGLYVQMKFQKPSKIQAISLPMILIPPYKDLIAQAHNGSGKTTCFVLGMLSRVDPKLEAPQALCVCPTRELANQNMEVLQKMGRYTGITSECAVPSTNNISIYKRPPVMTQIVIGTPGTIKKWMSFKKLGAAHLKILVFDEVVDIVVNLIPKIVKNYNQLFVKKEAVKQYKVYCPDELTKVQVIKDRIFEMGENLGQRMIFVKARDSASMFHKLLVEDDYSGTTIHGANKPEDRDKIVIEFKDGLTQVLIATNLLARGFDQQHVNLVVNYDLPLIHPVAKNNDLPMKHEMQVPEPDYEVYLHRVGRAGRFGRKATVLNSICGDGDEIAMAKIKKHFGCQVAEVKNSDEAYRDALKAAGFEKNSFCVKEYVVGPTTLRSIFLGFVLGRYPPS